MGSVAASRAVGTVSGAVLVAIGVAGAYRAIARHSDALLFATLIGATFGVLLALLELTYRHRHGPREVTSRIVFLTGLAASIGGQLLFRSSSGSAGALGLIMGFLLGFTTAGSFGSASWLEGRQSERGSNG